MITLEEMKQAKEDLQEMLKTGGKITTSMTNLQRRMTMYKYELIKLQQDLWAKVEHLKHTSFHELHLTHIALVTNRINRTYSYIYDLSVEIAKELKRNIK